MMMYVLVVGAPVRLRAVAVICMSQQRVSAHFGIGSGPPAMALLLSPHPQPKSLDHGPCPQNY